jgi:tetratricopeptide (TPR) repeat protein
VLLLACRLNIAQAAINLHDYSKASEWSTKAIKSDPTNVKALFRRAVARTHLGLPDEALEDLKKALELDPSNNAVKVEIVKVKKMIQESNKKAKAAYSGIFSKLSVYDDKALPQLGNSKFNPKVCFPYS